MRYSKVFAFWPVLLGLIALDCTTKTLAVEKLSPAHIPHQVIGDVVRFTLAYNPHAAMGLSLGSYSRVGFALLAATMLGVLVVYRRQISAQNTVAVVAIALIGGGAAGNMLDRVRSSLGVVDFIDVGVGNTRFYTFNVADAGVFCGTLLLFIVMMRRNQQESAGNAEVT
ncbi:MAG: signal peptidase II [Gemmatimonadaceae bacterium]